MRIALALEYDESVCGQRALLCIGKVADPDPLNAPLLFKTSKKFLNAQVLSNSSC